VHQIASVLAFLSTRYNEGRLVRVLYSPIFVLLTPMQWSDVTVYTPLAISFLSFFCFLLVEFFMAPEPVLPPSLLKQKIPILVGMSNFLVAMCNFTIAYFFPVWFETVGLTSASIAGVSLPLVHICMR
jgi:hypothetical protein